MALEIGFAQGTVVADRLDLEQASVGVEADLAQRRQVMQPPAESEVAGIVDGGFGAQRLSVLVILLDAAVLIVHMQRRRDPVGDDAGAKASGGACSHAAAKDQLHLTGAADVQILADHVFEEHTTAHRLVEHLGERELGLQDGQAIAAAASAILFRERMRQAREPLAQQSINLGGIQAITDASAASCGLAHDAHAVVERFEGDAALAATGTWHIRCRSGTAWRCTGSRCRT